MRARDGNVAFAEYKRYFILQEQSLNGKIAGRSSGYSQALNFYRPSVFLCYILALTAQGELVR